MPTEKYKWFYRVNVRLLWGIQATYSSEKTKIRKEMIVNCTYIM